MQLRDQGFGEKDVEGVMEGDYVRFHSLLLSPLEDQEEKTDEDDVA